MKNIIPFLLVIIIAGGAGFGFQRYLQNKDHNLPAVMPESATNNVINTYRPDFELFDLEGKLRNVKEWDNKVLLINFWATWCPPCKKEMPAFIEIYEQYNKQGFEILGLALDDKDSVQNFVDTLGVEYPIMIAAQQGIELSRLYGNRIGALPYSVFIGRDGKIIYTHAGELSKAQVESIIKPLLEKHK